MSPLSALRRRRAFALLPLGSVIVALATSLPVRAEVARFAEVEGFARLLEGDPHSVMLSEEGAIGLRPASKERFADAAMKFGAAGSFGDEVVLATLGAQAALVAIDERGRARPLFALGDALVTRLVEISAGKKQRPGLWAATTEKGKATLLWWPREEKDDLATAGAAPEQPGRLVRTEVPARLIWDIAADGQGGAYLATGEPGALMHIDAKRTIRTLFTPQEAHLKLLWRDEQLGLFAGGGERGIVYHAPVTSPQKLNKLRALFDTGNQEVTGLRSDGERLYVTSVTGQTPAVEGEPRPHKASEVRSSLHRVEMDGGAEIMAASGDELLFDLTFDEEMRLLVATGAVSKNEPRGRLYRVETKRKMLSLIYQSTSRRIARLLPFAHKTVLVEQDGTRLTTLAQGVQSEGCYLSPVVDGGVMARFGLVQVFGDLPRGSRAQISVRSGQTPEPDASWSNFSAPIEAPANVPVQVPNGRFAQLKVLLRGDHASLPSVYKLRLAYLRQNLPPFIQDIFSLPAGQALYALTPGATGEDGHSRIVSLAGKADEPDPPLLTTRKTPTRARQVAEPGAMTLRWAVDEPNGDELEYTLGIRGPGEHEFRTVAERFPEPFYTFHSAQLADGWYTFRLTASDARSNPSSLARSDQRDSRAILLDNSPPVFRHLRAEMKKGRVVITGSISDRYSPLLVLNASLDGGPLRPVMPEDGLLDGLKETFAIALGELSPGPHTVTVWARDEADNVGHASVQFAGPKGR